MAHIRGLVEVVAAKVAVGQAAVHSVVGRVILPAVQHVELVEAVMALRDVVD